MTSRQAWELPKELHWTFLLSSAATARSAARRASAVLAGSMANALDDLNVYAWSTGMIVAFEPVVTLRALL
jgi:hypothetical protein